MRRSHHLATGPATMTGRLSDKRAARGRASRQQGLPSMSPLQVEAYLLSRDTLRRIRRSSRPLEEADLRAEPRYAGKPSALSPAEAYKSVLSFQISGNSTTSSILRR